MQVTSVLARCLQRGVRTAVHRTLPVPGFCRAIGAPDGSAAVSSRATSLPLCMISRDPNKGGRGNTLPGREEEGVEFIGKGRNLTRVIDSLEKEMREAAANLEFELAARLRDDVKKLRDLEIGLGVEKVLGPAD